MNSGLPPVRWTSTSTRSAGGGAAGKRTWRYVATAPADSRGSAISSHCPRTPRSCTRAATGGSPSGPVARNVPISSSRADSRRRSSAAIRSSVESSAQCRSSSTRTTGAVAPSASSASSISRSIRARVAPWARVADRHAHGPGLEQPRELDQPGRRALRQHADDRVPLRAARELAQRLQHRQVRLDLAAVAQALADAQQRARAGLGEEGVDEGALPDARLAADHHRAPAPRLRGGERRAQPRELVVPADRCRALGLDDRRGGRRGERGVVLEDPALERARGVAGREPELAQPRGEPAVGLERLDLAPGAVEREHQRRHELLAQRIGRDQPAQHRHRLERPAERDEGAGALLLRLRAQVLEPAPLGLRPVGVGEVPERRPAPQLERRVERRQRRVRREPGRRAHALLEAVGVELVGRDREPVARALAHEQRGRRAAVAVRLEERAQVRHPDRERARRGVARDAGPARLEQRVGRHGAPGVDEQPRQDRALLRAGWGGAGGGPVDLDRAEDAEFHGQRTLRERPHAVNAP